MDYEKNCEYCFQNFNIKLLANMYFTKLEFNQIDIFLNSEIYRNDSINNIEEFRKTIFKGYGNEEFRSDKIEGIYLTKANSSNYINKLNYENNEHLKMKI